MSRIAILPKRVHISLHARQALHHNSRRSRSLSHSSSSNATSEGCMTLDHSRLSQFAFASRLQQHVVARTSVSPVPATSTTSVVSSLPPSTYFAATVRSEECSLHSHRTQSVFRDGQFHNPWPTFKEKTMSERLWDVGHWLSEARSFPLRARSYKNQHLFPSPYDRMQASLDLDTHLPIMRPNFELVNARAAAWTSHIAAASSSCSATSSSAPSLAADQSDASITYTWIGHATCLVQLGSLTILTDPWFSQRPSAWQRVGPKRIRAPACSIAELPPLDIIVISHNHFDHCDYNSCLQLHQRVTEQERLTGRSCVWHVPLGLGSWLQRWISVPAHRIVELDWWQQHNAQLVSNARYSVTAVPAQHWTSRYALLDNRHMLWCGFVIEHQQKRFYFAGDTGMCSVFREIGDEFSKRGGIDLAAIPIGAYLPRWLLQGAHVQPDESVRIHQDVGSKRSVAIHWGTVLLSDEFVMEPQFELQRLVKSAGIPAHSFTTSKHGETLII